ncbi:MAG TPA: type IV pilus assembly protein PilM [Desulfotomaculum sp.]|nr:type IV pilus assembly protein PilM [Desulfotomaculum sp.]
MSVKVCNISLCPDARNSWRRRLFCQRTALAGVDLGTREIRVVKVKAVGGVPEVTALGRAPTPREAFADGMRLEKVATALREALGQAGTEITDAVTAISGEKVIIRQIRMPRMPESEVQAAIRWEAERQIPVPLDELVVDHVTLGEVVTEEARQLEVLLIGAPRQTVHEYYNLFAQAGLRLVAVEIGTFALWRLFAGSQKAPPPGAVGILDIGAKSTQFVVMRDGRIKAAHALAVGGNAVTEALAKTYTIEFAEAERLKEGKGEIIAAEGEAAAATEPETAKLDYALRAGLAEFVREVRRSLSWYQSQHRGAPLERFLLSGGGAKLKGIAPFLTEELGLPVEVGVPGVRVKAGGQPAEYDPGLATVIGLALREVLG